MSVPVFSIVTPCLNDLDLLKRCVQSVSRQDDAALEHWVQDGGSTDGTPAWLASRTDLGFVSEPDQGLYDALNRGFHRARGDIMGWLNADEQYVPHALQSVQRAFEARPEIDIVFGDYIVTDTQGEALAARREIPFRRWTVVNGAMGVQSCALFFRKCAWEACGPFDISYRICGDKEWVLRAAGKRLVFQHIPRFLGLFTITGRNLCLSADTVRESEAISRQYGASRHSAVRWIARCCRVAERAVRGCYIPRTVEYAFCEGEGETRTRTCRVGGRWPRVASRCTAQ